MPSREDDRPRFRPALIGAWLEHRGLTPAQLARMTGETPQHIGRLIAGKRQYTQEKLESMAAALGVSVLELLFVDPRQPGAREALAAEITRVPEQHRGEAASYLRYLAQRGEGYESAPPGAPATPGRSRKTNANNGEKGGA